MSDKLNTKSIFDILNSSISDYNDLFSKDKGNIHEDIFCQSMYFYCISIINFKQLIWNI